MKLTYLLIDLISLSVPFLASFHPKLQFYKTWKAFFLAVTVIAIFFIIFDSLFTSIGVWSFNPDYITGVYLHNLPVEEILFFFSIPYACVFTYFCLDKFFDLSWNVRSENIFCILLSFILLITGFIFLGKIYTSSTCITTALLCLFLKFILHVRWFGKAVTVFAILIIPFLIVNGILTGSGLSAPVVRYNPSGNLGIRILTIPAEDFLYGFNLFLFTLSLYIPFKKQFSQERIHKLTSSHV